MGEIDTKPIESVQAALCYFGEKNELRRPNRDLDFDTQQKDHLDELHKELANYKVQLEAKESENLQALLNLQHYRKTVSELSAKLEECKAERDAYIGESRTQIQKLETEMADQLSEASKVKEQLWQATELISLRNQMVQDLEHQLLSNSMFMDSLQSELRQAREISSCSEEAVDDLRAKLEDEERRAAKQALYIDPSQMEQGLLRMELKNAKEDMQLLNCQVENLAEEIECVKLESNKRENELHIEIAKLKKNLHGATNKQENSNIVVIPVTEYQSLLAVKADEAELRNEVDVLKKEQEAVMLKVNEFRTRAEQAVSRAESAERAKVALEGQLRKWREQKQKRRAAQAALKQATLQTEPTKDDNELPIGKYQPLGKVLNMKF